MPENNHSATEDPWSAELPSDYNQKIIDFGLTPFDKEGDVDDLINRIEDPHYTMLRGIMFAHRDFNSIVDAINSKEPFIMMTGLMPSGGMHLGHKLVVEQMRWYQDRGAQVVIAISDTEAWVARGITSEESKRIAIEDYITNYLALGLDPEKSIDVYSQWERPDLLNLALAFSGKKTVNEMQKIYGFSGDTPAGKTFFPFIQVADILHPQLPRYGGPRPTVVPVGIDQDPHLRLTRDIADSWRKFNFEATAGHGDVVVYVKNAEDLGDALKRVEEEVIGMGFEKRKLKQMRGEENPRTVDVIYKLPNSNAVLIEDAGQEAMQSIADYVGSVIEGAELYVTNNRFGVFVEQNEKSADLLSRAESAARELGYEHIEVIPGYGAMFIYDNGEINERELDEKLLGIESTLGTPVFYKPASTYNKLARGLTGGKMSSSEPNSAIFLTDTPEEVTSKIRRAETGGRPTAAEQREKGGQPENCMVYELMLFGHPDDNVVKEMYRACTSGENLCGGCKGNTAAYFSNWMSEFQQRRNDLIESGKVAEFIAEQKIFRKEDPLC
jgi:tryptophanyl-tRNA synthetase